MAYNPKIVARIGEKSTEAPKLVDDGDGAVVRDAKQALRHNEMFTEAVEKALVGRLTDHNVPNVTQISMSDWSEMRQDPNFEHLSKYAPKLLEYADGRLRETPVRPLLQNEVGMYKGRIVVVNENVDGSKISPMAGYGGKAPEAKGRGIILNLRGGK
jgi:hypothetical protein